MFESLRRLINNSKNLRQGNRIPDQGARGVEVRIGKLKHSNQISLFFPPKFHIHRNQSGVS